MKKTIVYFGLVLVFLFIGTTFSVLKTTKESTTTQELRTSKEFSQMLAMIDTVLKKADKNVLEHKVETINKELLSLEDEVDVLNSKTTASYYHDMFNGRKTASGEIFSNKELTAAHKTLPFGSQVRVTNILNNESVIVTINDRGPFVKGRSIDLSKVAFNEIKHKKGCGLLKVKLEVLPNDYIETKEELEENLEALLANSKDSLREFSI